MRAAIIPPEKLAFFDITLTSAPCLRVGPVLIHSGPHAGNYAINEAILTSCPEWVAVAGQARTLCEVHGVPIEEIDPSDLRNPEAITP